METTASSKRATRRKSQTAMTKMISMTWRYALLIILSLIFIFPFYLMLRNGLATDKEITSPNWTFFPSQLHFEKCPFWMG